MKIFMVSIPVEDPVKAHKIYTTKLGFISKDFNPEAQIAVVASSEDPDGTVILLKPCKGTFYETYQKSVYDANLPIMVFKSKNVNSELDKFKNNGIKAREDLSKPEYCLMNLFEDGCGNLLMLQE